MVFVFLKQILFFINCMIGTPPNCSSSRFRNDLPLYSTVLSILGINTVNQCGPQSTRAGNLVHSGEDKAFIEHSNTGPVTHLRAERNVDLCIKRLSGPIDVSSFQSGPLKASLERM